ncbi:uncharacterized protein LOC123313034 isoform X2 [Coccinella septempunctata]|uniref:uncharacterized protein LOC123313034 isoform X2 n=1 Tax=Coccinella septempunctata TaxID=41139 RepID=UPI001D060583|nr:uncharacterized protein LOC123313034 isoform X2 [Coccinella septempunctata]
MEVAQTPSNGGLPPPFHDHDVHEWSTLDSLTGVLERARIETDHWAANTTNTSHKYGKVVDSRARTDADGALRQQARRQLEVFQSQVPGGHLQVIKSHSVSSSRWTNKRIEEAKGGEFEGLQIPSNQLDLSFQKSRAVIGRSAARRPPTRIKNKDDTSPIRQDNLHRVASANLQKVTRLCHQIHENAVKQSFGKFTNGSPIENRLKITSASEKNDEATNSSNGHTNLLRTKSSSSEDFLINLNKDKSTKSIEDLEDLEHLQTWRRTSKIRRSLQYPKLEKPLPNKPIDLPETSVSVRKITEDFEKGRRLSTALRGNNIDLQALDQILQTISSSSSEKNSTLDEEAESSKINSLQSKRNSFVTVESIQEIKGRLRRTSSPDNNPYQKVKDQEIDDGIVTEDSYKTEEKMIDSGRVTGHAKVKSYVFGMDYMKKPMIGTGSLESRSKLLNGTTNRSEDWYNRRKSYGFEPVHNQNETMSSNKKLVESSTDSGICRSSEVIIIPSAINHVDPKGYASNNNGGLNNNIEKDASFGNVRRISSLFDNPTTKTNSFHPEFNSSWTKKNKENDWSLNPGITIKIPIVSNNSHWDDHPERDIKRHSIAVDETKYVSKSTVNNEARRTSLVINEKFLNAPTTTEGCDSDYSGLGKKSKKVEFCKTEVHFAAESGKVNIVETDEKPPPTQNFRRRRRNPSYPSDFNKNGLPVLHFGENYVEKTLFANGNQQYPEEVASGEETEPSTISRTPISHVVTVNSDFNSLGAFDDDRRESAENESIKGILKNKMVKPKPYHLGQNPIDFNFFDDENRNWSSEKFPEKDPPPIWKSTVTVSSTIFDNRKVENNNSILNNQPDLIKDQLKRLEDYHHDLRRVEPTERTRPFLSVADRIRNMEESQKVDNHRGYSTRVNIGEGQAIVVQNNALNKHDMFTEPVKQEPKVRIGRENSTSKHMVCSKTTTDEKSSNTTTTTKITIDLSPTEDEDHHPAAYHNAKQNGSHSFKSTSLILNTIKSQNEPEKLEKVPYRIPQQLEALKRLYEDENSDSDADKEVQLLTSRIAERQKLEEDAHSSVVSGSWSRMRAYKNVLEKTNQKKSSDTSSSKRSLAQIEKDSKLRQQTEATNRSEEPIKIKAEIKNRKYSPIVLRKHPIVIKTAELKSANTSTKLSSPLLVGRSSNNIENKVKTRPHDIRTAKADAESKPVHDFNTIEENNQNGFVSNEKILRQPKKSEMAYFGVPISSQVDKTTCENHIKEIRTSTNKTSSLKREQVHSARTDSPIYQNISPTQNEESKENSKFDSCILEELTKAADEILQAVKDYSEEESRKQKELEETKTELSTITENKTWKQETKVKSIERPCKSKLRNASSNSSLETSPKDSKPTHRYISNTKASADKIKTRTSSSESSGLKASTRARRLQRASSREALLQSHGSSSEDLATNEVPVRKPRLVRKTKTTQLTVTNGMEMARKGTIATNAKKKVETTKAKTEERLPGALPEIRHKTAVSTIRSTAEKAARDRSKHRGDDVKKKVAQCKEITKVSASPTTPVKSKRETVTHRLATAYVPACSPSHRKTHIYDYYQSQDQCPCLCS